MVKVSGWDTNVTFKITANYFIIDKILKRNIISPNRLLKMSKIYTQESLYFRDNAEMFMDKIIISRNCFEISRLGAR